MNRSQSHQALRILVVEALQHFKKETSVSDINSFVVDRLNVACVPDNFIRQISFSRTYLRKFGIITNTRHGYWTLNEKFYDLDLNEINREIKLAEKEYYSLRFDKRPK